MTILNFINIIKSGYGGYALLDINIFGWGTIVICIIATIVLTVSKGNKNYKEIPEEREAK